MIPLIDKKERDTCSCTQSVVVGKLHKRQEISLVVMLVVTIYMEVLFQSLITPLTLAIPLWIPSRDEVEIDIQALLRERKK